MINVMPVACRSPWPTSGSEHYRQGVSCPHCHDRRRSEQVKRYAERERQVELAKRRGESHIGQSMRSLIEERRREKLRFKDRTAPAGEGETDPWQWWELTAAALISFCIGVCVVEICELRRDLNGYADYTQHTRGRLIPGGVVIRLRHAP